MTALVTERPTLEIRYATRTREALDRRWPVIALDARPGSPTIRVGAADHARIVPLHTLTSRRYFAVAPKVHTVQGEPGRYEVAPDVEWLIAWFDRLEVVYEVRDLARAAETALFALPALHEQTAGTIDQALRAGRWDDAPIAQFVQRLAETRAAAVVALEAFLPDAAIVDVDPRRVALVRDFLRVSHDTPIVQTLAGELRRAGKSGGRR